MTTPATKSLLLRLYRDHVRRYRATFVLAFLMMALSAATTAALAKLMEPVLDEIFVGRQQERLYQVAIAVFVVFALKSVATYGETLLMNGIGYRVISDMQKRLFGHLLHADRTFFQQHTAGGLVARFTSDVLLLRATVSSTVTSIGKDALTLIFLVGVMFWQDWALAAASFIVFPVSFWPIIRIGRRMRKVTGVTQGQIAAFTSQLAQIFQGMRQVQAYGREDYEQRRLDATVDETQRLLLKANRIRAGAPPLMELLGGVAIVIVIIYGGSQVIDGSKTTGNFFSFITALLMAYDPIKKLSRLNTQMQEGVAAAERLYVLLDTPSRLPVSHHQPDLRIEKARIEFDDVTFTYPGEAQPVLQQVSFVIEPGQTVALVGASGGGKSTIINLLLRFYDVDSGCIRIDGQDIRRVNVASVRRAMALVAQETLLFENTVAHNIGYGDLDADEAAVRQAAQHAAAADFIDQLPDGYDTMVGEHGSRLSGGQRQRIAIARAMLKNAPILLLDEATSALDNASEQQVQAVLDTVMGGKTALVIAHRLTTVRHAHTIHVLERGRIMESGNHDSLLAQQGVYAALISDKNTT